MVSALYRGSSGVHLIPEVGNEGSKVLVDPTKNCRAFTFSPDGRVLAFFDGLGIRVMDVDRTTELAKLSVSRAHALQFSPRGTHLVTWEQYRTTPNNPTGDRNLTLWDARKNFQQVAAFFQKKFQFWAPQWTADEAVAARMGNNELQFYADGDFTKIANKIHIDKVSAYGMSSIGSFATFVPGSKGQPCFVRVYKYPNLTAVLAQRSFYKAENVEFKWNVKGTCVLAVAQTEVDDTGTSYYGQTTLHFLDVSGETQTIQLAKKGPVYAVEWNPASGDEFCVVYGFMPASATLFSKKCEPVFEFKTGKRNAVYFNNFGNMLILAGFGNLRGNIEVWGLDGADRGKSSPKLAAQFAAPDSTLLHWGPDGQSILTATCSPRLKIGNGYKFWDYHGNSSHSLTVPEGEEIWDVIWRPAPPGTYQKPKIEYLPNAGASNASGTGDATVAAYRPPMARNQPIKEFKLHHSDDEDGPTAASIPGLSKSAQKNKKKREKKSKAIESDEGKKQDSVKAATNGSATAGGADELAKKVRNLEKKLLQIQKIKEDRDAGKALELNQLQKLQKEDEFRAEIAKLKIESAALS